MTQTELMRESFRHNQEINELLQKQEELQERLAEEARAREQLALELHRAEGEFCFELLSEGSHSWVGLCRVHIFSDRELFFIQRSNERHFPARCCN